MQRTWNLSPELLLAQRNEVFRALHVELVPYRFGSDPDAMQVLLDDVLRGGPLREMLDALGLEDDPRYELVLGLERDVERVLDRDDEVTRAIVVQSIKNLSAALEEACGACS